MKQFVLSALTAVTAFKYDNTKSGHCPYQPGEIKVDEEFDTKMLEGIWLNVFDRVDLKDHLQCYSAKFQALRDGEFQYSSMSHHLNDNVRKREGMNMNFNYIQDANNSVGMIENTMLEISFDNAEALTENLKKGSFDSNLFEAQFLRYAQIIDTDKKNFMVKYQCLETAIYTDKKTGKELTPFEAFDKSQAWIDVMKRPIVTFQFGEEINVEPRYYEDIKILWKPFVEETTNYNEKGDKFKLDVVSFPQGDDAPTDDQIEYIKRKIQYVIPGDRFSDEVLNKQYGLQEHATDGENNCDYDPMSVTMDRYTNEYYGYLDSNLPKADLFFTHHNEL